MKNRIINVSLLAFAAVLSTVSLNAQTKDTVKVHDTVRETIREKETVNVVHDTVKVPATPDRPKLRCGEFGLRFMPTFTSLSLNTYNGTTVRGDVTMSNGYGVMVGVNFSKNIGLQGEVNYLEISQKYKDMNLDREVHISYVNIPLMLSLNTDKTMPVNLNVVVGPQFGINVGSSVKTTGGGSSDTLHAVIAVKQGDVGLAYGAGLEFALNKMHTIRFDLGFRGMYGLMDISGNNPNGGNTYNVLIHASRKSYSGYGGFTFVF